MQSVRARPALADGLLLVGAEDGRLYAFDAADHGHETPVHGDAAARGDKAHGGSEQ